MFKLLIIATFLSLSFGSAFANITIFSDNFDKNFRNGISKPWADNSSWADVDVKYEPSFIPAIGEAQLISVGRISKGYVQFIRPNIQLLPNQVYRVKLVIKADQVMQVNVLLRKRGKPYTKYYSKKITINSSLKDFEFNILNTEHDSNAYFMIQILTTGNLYIKKIELVQIDTGTGSSDRRSNLLKNSYFKHGLDGWSSLIRETSPEYFMRIGYLDPKPSIVEGEEGAEYSIDIPQHASLLLTSKRFVANSEKSYVLRIQGKTNIKSKNVSLSIKSGKFPHISSINQVLKFNNKYRYYELEFDLPPSPDGLYYLQFTISGKVSLNLRQIQLIETSCIAFINDAQPEIGISLNFSSNIFSPNDRCELFVKHDESNGLLLKILVCDYFNHEIFNKEVVVSQDGQYAFDLPSSEVGYYLVLVKLLENNRVIDESRIGYCVINNNAAISNPFLGGHYSFNKSDLQIAKVVGTSWLRLHPPHGTKWFAVEPTPGQFVFCDEPFTLAQKMGFNILGTLGLPPKWASARPLDGEYKFQFYPPLNINDWADYVKKTVLHYPHIQHWEVWNEPDGKFLTLPNLFQSKAQVYTKLLKVAYEIIKSINPSIYVIGGCPTHSPSEWVDQIGECGALDYMDIFSFHNYSEGIPMDISSPSVSTELKLINATFNKYSKKFPIWETESGPGDVLSYIDVDSEKINYNEFNGANYLVRTAVHLMSQNVKKWFLYSMIRSRRPDRTSHSVFFESNDSPRPSLAAYANFVTQLDGFKFIQNYKSEDVAFYEFYGNEQKLTILWSLNKPSKLSLQDVVQLDDTAVDIMGKVIPPNEFDNYIIGVNPVYVYGHL
jgi:hypothetical protein